MPIPIRPTPSGHVTRNPRPAGTPLGAFTVELGGMLLGVVHHSGANLHISNLTGWWETAGSTGEATQRPNEHGGWLDEAYYESRVIALTVTIDTASWEHTGQLLADLLGTVDINALSDMVVVEDMAGLLAAVRLDDPPAVTRQAGRAVVTLPLLAPDPRRYSVVEANGTTGLPSTAGGLSLPAVLPLSVGAAVTTGRVALSNPGNMAAPLVLTVTGPTAAGTSITHLSTGRRMVIPDPVPAGRRLVIDTAARTALLDGTASRPVVGAWLDATPGANEYQFDAPAFAAAARLQVTFRPAYK